MRRVDLDRLLSKLEKVRRRREDDAMTRCPAHEDREPSLHITRTGTGDILWKCHAGCTQQEVTDALRRIDAIPPAENPEPDRFARTSTDRRTRRRRRRSEPLTNASRGLATRIWQAAELMVDGPGAAYQLIRGVWRPPGHREVRWIAAEKARNVTWKYEDDGEVAERRGCRPKLPGGDDIAGVIVYRFSTPDDPRETAGACQIEAVRDDGTRALFLGKDKVKRPSVAKSDFADGRRVFHARTGAAGAGVYICEGPLDALALNALAHLGEVRIGPGAIIGVPGTGSVSLNNVGGDPGAIWVAVDNDQAGDNAVERLIEELREHGMTGRRRNLRPNRDFSDWTEQLEHALKRR